MIKLSFSQKSACGFKYILDKTEPYSAPGKNALKKAEFFAPDKKAELLTELENVERLKKAVACRSKEVSRLESVFFHLKDLHNTFARLSHTTLDEVELFELKAFLRLVRQAAEIAANLSAEYGLEDFVFRNTDEAFDLLKADKGEGFFVEDGLSDKLFAARRGQGGGANAAPWRARKTKSDSQPQSKLISKRRRGRKPRLKRRAQSCVLCSDLLRRIFPTTALLRADWI